MKLYEIRWKNMIMEAKYYHHDFGKFMGDLMNGNKTIWLYPKKGAYDFKKEIVKLKKAFGKMKVDHHEMDSVELTLAKPLKLKDPENWWKVITDVKESTGTGAFFETDMVEFPKAKIKQLKTLTHYNNHMEALILIAKEMDMKSEIKTLQQLIKKAERSMGLDATGSELKRRIYTKVMDKAKRTFSNYKDVYQST